MPPDTQTPTHRHAQTHTDTDADTATDTETDTATDTETGTDTDTDTYTQTTHKIPPRCLQDAPTCLQTHCHRHTDTH